jgi:hypothetical protein
MALSTLKLFVASLSANSKVSQIQRYETNHSPVEIMNIISFGGGPKMGAYMESFARFNFPSLQVRSSTGHDHRYQDYKIEQKSSGHWGETDYKWQHVEEKHDWDILLLCGIDYTCIRFWTMNRRMFRRMLEEGKITNQGKKSGESSEGVWFNYSDVQDSLTEIQTDAQLRQAVEASRE